MQSTEPEIWLPVVGYEGSYEVSDSGSVRSVDRYVRRGAGEVFCPGQTMAPYRHRNGRLMVRLSSAGSPVKRFTIHRLVLEAFVGPRPAGTEACHFDDDRDNNHVSNLRWDTRSANMRDRIRNGRHNSSKKTHCPHGHDLVEPNLMQALYRNAGFRSCRACNLAIQHAKYRGTSFDVAVADAKYAEIMSGAKPTRPKRKREPALT